MIPSLFAFATVAPTTRRRRLNNKWACRIDTFIHFELYTWVAQLSQLSYYIQNQRQLNRKVAHFHPARALLSTRARTLERGLSFTKMAAALRCVFSGLFIFLAFFLRSSCVTPDLNMTDLSRAILSMVNDTLGVGEMQVSLQRALIYTYTRAYIPCIISVYKRVLW